MADRPYIFYELTNSVCSKCLRRVEAKVILQDDCVYLLKHCPEHKFEKVLIATDIDYFKKMRSYLKPAQMPLQFNTPIKYGCPYDCGLCPDHEQHSCLSLIEVTDQCNLKCPVCYAESSPTRLTHRSLEQIEFMMDCVVRNEGKPDVVQISGGEPTIHPDFFKILDAAKKRPIKHLMLNTNGVRIAQEEEFAKRLGTYMPGFEVYLQFDSLRDETMHVLRGEGLLKVRLKALEYLNKYNVSTTLVVTLKKGLNDNDIGAIMEFALQQPCVRGVTLQPIQVAGRTENFDPAKDRLTLTDIRRGIIEQSSVFAAEDVVPVPCHPDCLAMAYALKVNGEVIPLTGKLDPQVLLHGEGNTIVYEHNEKLRGKIMNILSPKKDQSGTAMLKHLLCCLPLALVPPSIGYQNIFRVLIVQFLDAYNFDVRSVKKSCIHIVHPDGRIIPFDTFNMFYRDGREAQLKELHKLYEPAM